MKNNKAQSIIEFCFASIVLMLLLYGMVQTVRWVMTDIVERRYDHDTILVSGGDARSQLSPNFHKIRFMDAVMFQKE